MNDPTMTGPNGDPPSSTQRRRVRFVWLPILGLITAAVAVVLLFRSDLTNDIKLAGYECVIGTTLVLLTLWFAFCYVQSRRMRWVLLLTPFVVAAAFIAAVSPKFDGDLAMIGLRWRWAPAADRALDVPEVTGKTDIWRTTPFDFPGFLGPNGNGVITNVTLETNWISNPPRELWRTKIGAGWSGFAIVGEYAVTQEQRGENEMAVCRRVRDGEIVWTHKDPLRFDSSHPSGRIGGPGPRATPTIHNGKVFTQGATGILNCLDASLGKLLWSHDTIAENDGEVVLWGKSGSPLVVDENVVISVGGPGGKSLVAYDIATGSIAWSGGKRQSSYATPVQATLAGKRQILCVNENWLTAHDVANGNVLWEHEWPGDSSTDASNSNPIPVGDDRIFLCKGYGASSELIQITRSNTDGFSTRRLWKKPVMRTKMTNAIVYGDHIYGLDGGILQCVELVTGKKIWKRGRYGHGQVLLIGDVLLITTEKTGEVILVDSSPNAKGKVLARHKVLAGGGKMWNYPALAGKYLIVRNAEEAACYELAVR